ncbi:hypothetical protein [Kitasatospora cystarginea]
MTAGRFDQFLHQAVTDRAFRPAFVPAEARLSQFLSRHRVPDERL